MDPLDGIAAFARVVDSGSFSAAARRLKISKSAVSAHVQRLEERLGTRLLNRTTRRLSLTEAGAAYYRHCARILAEAEAAEQAASALQREPRGTLRISAPDCFGSMHVAPAVPLFLKRYPDLAVDISLSPKHVNLVDEGLEEADDDLALVELPDLLGRRPLDAKDDVRIPVEDILTDDLRAGGGVVGVRDGGPLPCSRLDEDGVTGRGQLAQGLRHEGDSPLVRSALLDDGNLHPGSLK